MKESLRKRHRKERWFRRTCLLSLCFAVFFLLGIFADILHKGYPAFLKTEILGESAHSSLVNPFASYQMKKGATWVTASEPVDKYYKKNLKGSLSEEEIQNIETLKEEGRIRLVFNGDFFTNSDSSEPELAGIWGALLGSLMMLGVAVCTAFPLGIGAAVYLEEYAPDNRLTHFLEANINNLASVPSVIFGLLGLMFFIHFLGLPRPSVIVGGLTIGLMVLPIMVVATRAALITVPSSLKEAALGLGASPLQVLFHHTLPSALSGIMTGAILSMARVLGETAPLAILGMISFIANPPSSLFDPATVLSIQIFSWSKSPEIGFIENTSGAILVLLTLVIFLNGSAVWIRKKVEAKYVR